MKIQEKCLPCVVNQAIQVANLVGIQDKTVLLHKVFTYLSEVDFEQTVTPELIGQVFRLLKAEIGNDDPYLETRQYYNGLFLEKLESFRADINGAKEPFLEAIKYAIIGNIIDFNPIHSLTLSQVLGYFEKVKQETLEIDDSRQLYREVEKAEKILYLGDNCGEICLDRLLIEKMKEINPDCRIYFATRGAAVVNDSIEEDAYMVGMQEYATVLSNGDDSLGTVLHRTCAAFRKIYDQADIVIAKGQANYECLSGEDKNIYFLLMTKCSVIAEDIGVPEKKMICKRQGFIKE